MSMKRVAILFWKNLIPSSRLFLLALIPSFAMLIVGLSHRFSGGNREWLDIFLPLWMDLMPLLIGTAAFTGFIQRLNLEKNNGTAEMLFSTPVNTKEYMFSLWFSGVVLSTLTIYFTMGIFAVCIGIERVAAHVSPSVWLQPPFLAITFVSCSGLIASLMLGSGSFIKKICYLIIIFAPIIIVVVLVWVMFIMAFIGLGNIPESLPAWVSWLLETLRKVEEMRPAFIYSPWARWLPTSVYMCIWFFILSRKIHIGNFVLPFPSWRSMFVPFLFRQHLG